MFHMSSLDYELAMERISDLRRRGAHSRLARQARLRGNEQNLEAEQIDAPTRRNPDAQALLSNMAEHRAGALMGRSK